MLDKKEVELNQVEHNTLNDSKVDEQPLVAESDEERENSLRKFDKPNSQGSSSGNDVKYSALLLFGICFSYMCVS